MADQATAHALDGTHRVIRCPLNLDHVQHVDLAVTDDGELEGQSNVMKYTCKKFKQATRRKFIVEALPPRIPDCLDWSQDTVHTFILLYLKKKKIFLFSVCLAQSLVYINYNPYLSTLVQLLSVLCRWCVL